MADNDGVLTFTGINFNETKTVTVQSIGDLNIENNETFTVLLSGISAPTPEQTSAITITGSTRKPVPSSTTNWTGAMRQQPLKVALQALIQHWQPITAHATQKYQVDCA